jgi:hypothetical protein
MPAVPRQDLSAKYPISQISNVFLVCGQFPASLWTDARRADLVERVVIGVICRTGLLACLLRSSAPALKLTGQEPCPTFAEPVRYRTSETVYQVDAADTKLRPQAGPRLE